MGLWIGREGKTGGGVQKKKKKKCEVSTFLFSFLFLEGVKKGAFSCPNERMGKMRVLEFVLLFAFFSKLNKRTQLLTRYICHFNNVASAARNVRK